mmetsp:Transcript_59111/g.103936  ORF Transcript_59111/g.103936 Transcript_59111/m.103936 type:complete len:228 (+) Transcript_59111:896-1579(+)
MEYSSGRAFLKRIGIFALGVLFVMDVRTGDMMLVSTSVPRLLIMTVVPCVGSPFTWLALWCCGLPNMPVFALPSRVIGWRDVARSGDPRRDFRPGEGESSCCRNIRVAERTVAVLLRPCSNPCVDLRLLLAMGEPVPPKLLVLRELALVLNMSALAGRSRGAFSIVVDSCLRRASDSNLLLCRARRSITSARCCCVFHSKASCRRRAIHNSCIAFSASDSGTLCCIP